MKLSTFKCPDCGANLERKDSRAIMFCEYCGARIAMDDIEFFKEEAKTERVEQVLGTVKELYREYNTNAEKKRAEEEERRQREAPAARRRFYIEIGLCIAFLLIMMYVERGGI